MDKGYVQNTIFELLSRLGIGYEKLEHSPIITMKEGSPQIRDFPHEVLQTEEKCAFD